MELPINARHGIAKRQPARVTEDEFSFGVTTHGSAGRNKSVANGAQH